MTGCNNNSEQNTTDLNEVISDNQEMQGSELSDEVMSDLLQSIPSPMELASAIRKTGVEYDEALLNSRENLNTLTTTYDKAVNLGIYGGDLGYINIYEKSYDALNYLNCIKQLADDLKIGHFFDYATIKRLANNSDKIDSLLYISTANFNKMNSYLRSQERGNISALIVAGSWIEVMYIATHVASLQPHPELLERIGEQKVVLDQILLIISSYPGDGYFGSLSDRFREIKTIFDGVTITYHYEEPETKEVDGRLVIVNNSHTEIDIDSSQVGELRDIVGRVRNILSGNRTGEKI